MEIVIIAALAQNNIIGKKGELPWYLPEDLKRFKQLTLNHPVIMGRNTYESIVKRIGKPLSQRKSIIVTSKDNYIIPEGVVVARSAEEALKEAEKHGNKVFIIGGQRIFESFMNITNKLEITHVHKKFDGDVFFPPISQEEWRETKREDKIAEMSYSFVSYERINKT